MGKGEVLYVLYMDISILHLIYKAIVHGLSFLCIVHYGDDAGV
jgi:hypothetical protein